MLNTKSHEQFEGPLGEQPHDMGWMRCILKTNVFHVRIFVRLSDPPCFLESVFCQELEKTGFRFVRDRESNEIHLFLYRNHLSFNKMIQTMPIEFNDAN